MQLRSSAKNKEDGPISYSQAKKTKSMDAILGIQEMEVESDSDGSEEGEILSPKASIEALRVQSEDHITFSSWLSVMKSGESNPNRVPPIPILQSENDKIVRTELEDIQDEVCYWNSAIVCSVVGANPPLSVIEGFFMRIWKDLGVDKVASVEYGVYIVRFFTMENRDKVLSDYHPTFDKKPVICKPWHNDIVNFKDEISVVPIWIQLKNLNLKFWGEKCLRKIVGSMGEFIQVDRATLNRDKLLFARVQVEVMLKQSLPEKLQFQDEN
ncbi:hypothetical protein BVRB_8g189880 [Beta vulgaris subsp. vulgaris]|nr:hypothetical protein BVRB_8g189880 [Beta vulgaris subsp. vulgaris]